jgi:hypothetical protein
MMRKCDGTDQFLVKPVDGNFERCDCELEFDDVDYSVIHPHDRIPTRAEKEDLLNVLRDIWKN